MCRSMQNDKSRHRGKYNGVPLKIKILLIFVNLFILFIFFELDIILIITVLFFLVLAIYEMVFIKKNKQLWTEFFNLSGLVVLQYLKLSKKYIFASIFGLVFSIIILSQAFLLLGTYQDIIFQDVMKGEDPAGLTISPYDSRIAASSFNETALDYQSIGNRSIEFYQYTIKYVRSEGIFPIEIRTSEIPSQPNVQEEISVGMLTQEKLAFLSTNFRYEGPLSVEKNFAIGIFSQNLGSGINYENLNNSLPIAVYANHQFSYITSFPINSTTILLENEINDFYELQGNFEMKSPMILVSEDLFWKVFHQFAEPRSDTLRLTVHFFIEIPPLSEIAIEDLSRDLRKIQLKAGNDLFMGGIDGYALTYLKHKVDDCISTINRVKTTTLLSIGPIIGLGLYLVYFSINLVHLRKKNLISILKLRGSSEVQVAGILFAEVIISGIVSIAVGMILAIPWAIISLKTSGFFEFNNPTIFPLIPANWYWQIPIIGLIFSLDLNIFTVLHLSKTQITDEELFEEKSIPLWQKLHLDILLFGLGLIQYLALNFIHISQESAEILSFSLPYIAPFGLIAIIIGSSLLVSRYFSGIIGYFSRLIWYKNTNILALATRNLKNKKFSSSKLVSLLMLGMMLSISFFIVPVTLEGNAEEAIGYDIGADIAVTNLNPQNEADWDSIKDIQGVYSISEVSSGLIRLNDLTYIFLGINRSTFALSAFWKNSYASKPLSDLISGMTENTSVLVYQITKENLGREMGDNLPMISQNYQLNVEIVGAFQYFPILIDETLNLERSNDIIPIVIDYKTTLKFLEVFPVDHFKTCTYIKLEDDGNHTFVLEQLRNTLDTNKYSIASISEDLNEEITSPAYISINSSFQAMLVISFLSSLIAIIFFLFLTLAQRQKEIGVYRSLGMVKNQIFRLFFMESLIILFSGILTGLLLGVIIADFIIRMALLGSRVTPYEIYYPFDLLIAYIIIILLTGIISVLLPTRRISSKYVGSILRTE